MLGIKSLISDFLFVRSIRRHGGRLGWRAEGRYGEYLKSARASASPPLPTSPTIVRAIDEYRDERVTSYHDETTRAVAHAIGTRLLAREAAAETVWAPVDPEDSNRGYSGKLLADFPEIRTLFEESLGSFLTGFFRSHYKVYFGILYRSDHISAGPRNSALWHCDGGPGTCVNVMLYIDGVTADDGALEALPWNSSLQIFEKERAQMRLRLSPDKVSGLSNQDRRAIRCGWYREMIDAEFRANVRQPLGPAGLVVPFANNIIHRGGFPEPGKSRRAIVFHCYPSHKPVNWDTVERRGLEKQGGYPLDPREDF